MSDNALIAPTEPTRLFSGEHIGLELWNPALAPSETGNSRNRLAKSRLKEQGLGREA